MFNFKFALLPLLILSIGLSGCTKLNTEKNSRELSRKIEEINYGLGVVSIS